MTEAASVEELPLPGFFRPEACGWWQYDADAPRILDEAVRFRREHGIEPSGADRERTHLLLIDLQRDFCSPRGSLFVGGRGGRGAAEDSERLVRFIYRNLGRINDITCTLDTHLPYQIFFPAFWLDEDGSVPEPYRVVATEDLRAGHLRPNPDIAWWLCNGNVAWLERQVLDYCERLESAGRYQLYLWPPHCLLGSTGHALVGAVQEARLFHAYVRGSKCFLEVKGGHLLTENYSALAPEILERHDGVPLAQRNDSLLRRLFEADRLVVAGQAASHCVRATVEDLLHGCDDHDYDPGRIYVLEDCMSAVAIADPEHEGRFLVDFTEEAEAALAGFRDAGISIVRSTTPMSRWPELPR